MTVPTECRVEETNSELKEVKREGGERGNEYRKAHIINLLTRIGVLLVGSGKAN